MSVGWRGLHTTVGVACGPDSWRPIRLGVFLPFQRRPTFRVTSKGVWTCLERVGCVTRMEMVQRGRLCRQPGTGARMCPVPPTFDWRAQMRRLAATAHVILVCAFLNTIIASILSCICKYSHSHTLQNAIGSFLHRNISKHFHKLEAPPKTSKPTLKHKFKNVFILSCER